MWNLIVFSLAFIISLSVLIKAAGYFTFAAEKIGLFLGLSHFIIGVTIVSIGTSLPELVSSIFAVLKGSSEIVIGNVVGSNITNIFLILGAAAVISPKNLSIEYNLLDVDLPLFTGSAFLVALMVKDGQLSAIESMLLVLGFILYIFYAISPNTENQEESTNVKPTDISFYRQLFLLTVSGIFIFLGANFTIEYLIKVGQIVNIDEEIIAVTALAIGTSLPELIVTIISARKGNPEMAIGTILGSNIFNSFCVMGIPGLMSQLEIPQTIIDEGITVMLAGTILFVFTIQDKKVTKWEGLMFFLIYVWFIGKIFKLL